MQDSSSQATVRLATREDRTRVAATLAAAFQEDPVMVFFFPDPDTRRRRLPSVFALLFDSDTAGGACLVSTGGQAATLWRAPGAAHLSVWQKLRELPPWFRAVGGALGRVLVFSEASDANHPPEPHWYLHVAGCAPEEQGRGHGRTVIRAGLELADRDRLPAYLETATGRNLGYYQSFGFTITHDWQVRGGPRTWSLARPAASG